MALVEKISCSVWKIVPDCQSRLVKKAVMIFISFLSLYAQDTLKVHTNTKYFKDHFAIGYEEGLAFRYRIANKNFSLNGSFFYQLDISANENRRNLHEFGVRLGCSKDIVVFPRVRNSLYIEFMEKMKNIEYWEDSSFYKRNQIWNTDIRCGVMVSFYCVKNIMISWKIGLEYSSYYSTGWYYGNNENDREPSNEFGLCGRDSNILKTLFNNFGFYIFF